jgi:hypothetical protein
VITITPLAAREPYKDAAAASLITVIDSISLLFKVANTLVPVLLYPSPVFGVLKALIFPDCTGVPSITYKGSFPAFMEPIPRIRTDVVAPGAPENELICTPGIEPASLSSMAIVGISCNFSVAIVDAAPVKVDFLKVPYPVTTTSSRTSVSGFNIIFTTGLIATSAVCIPMYEICKVFAELQLYHNFFIIRVL